MPKLNRIRLGNIVYNNRKNIIGDETIDLHEESALLRMENGGGKSVLTQLLLAPYISGRLRNFPNRKFSDYFQDTKPSIVLQEWKLDDDAGYFLVGMVVRKKISSQKDETDAEENSRLDFLTFVAEYPEPEGPLSLSEYPILIRENNRPGYITYMDFRTHLDELLKAYPQSIRLYNMNTSGMAPRFRAKLAELGIEQIEWEQMRSFNQDESGLSTLADTNNTEVKLLSNVLLPAVGRKLDSLGGADHIEAFGETVRSYIEMALRNANIYETKMQRESFLQMLKELEPAAASVVRYENVRLEKLGSLNSFSKSLLAADALLELKINEGRELVEESEKERKLIQCEILSQKYYRNKNEDLELEGIMEDLYGLIEEKEDELAEAEQELRLLKLANYRIKAEEDEAQISSLTTQIESVKKDNAEIEAERSAVGSALHRMYGEQLETFRDQLEQTKAEIDRLETEKKNCQKKQNQLSRDLNNLILEEGKLQNVLETYHQKEAKFSKQYKAVIAHTLSYYEDEAVLEQVSAEFEQDKENKQKCCDDLAEKIARMESDRAASQKRREELLLEGKELDAELKDLTRQREEQNQILERRTVIARSLLFDEEELQTVIFSDEQLHKRLEQTRQELDFSIRSEAEQIGLQKRKIANLQTGCELDLPVAVSDVLSEMNLEQKTGSEVLKDSRMSAASKKKVLESHPFVPYSLILPEKRIDEFFKELRDRKIFTSSILPVVSRESLRAKPDLEETYQAGTARFYINYNSALIDEDELHRLLEQENRLLSRMEENLVTLQSAKDTAVEQLSWITANPLTRNEHEDLLRKIEKMQKAIQKNIEARNSKTIEIQHLEKQIELHSDQKKKADRNLHAAQQAFKDAKTLQQEYLNAVSCWQKEQALLEKKQNLNKENEQNTSRILQCDNQILQKTSLKKDQEHALTSCQENKAKYENYVSQRTIKGSIAALESRFEALSSKLKDSQLPFFNDQLTRVRKDRNKQNDLIKKLLEREQIQDERWKTMDSDESQIDSQSYEIDQIRDKKDRLKNEQDGYREQRIRLEEKMRSVLDRIEEISGVRQPKKKTETRDYDLKPELKEAEELIRSTQAEIKAVQEKKDSFARYRSQTEIQLRESGETEFQDIPLTDLSQTSEQEAAEMFEGLKDDLEFAISHKKQHAKVLYDRLSREKTKPAITQDEDLDGALRALLELVDQPVLFAEQLEKKCALLGTLLEKINMDLKNVEQVRVQTETMLYEYVQKVHEQVNLIDKDTTIQLHNRSRKMLKITQPEWEDHAALYRDRVHDFLADLVSRASKSPESMDETIRRSIQLNTLYNQVIGLSEVTISLYKVEENGETRIAWHNAGAASGAEGFLCAFTVVAAVLAYQRRDETGMISRSRKSSVMLMDNPFAKAHSPHIIQALMQMCDTMRVQFVAFSAVENTAILKAFNTIYSLRLIPRNDGRNHMLVESRSLMETQDLETIEIHVS